jgi:hypothetical protein
MIKNIKWLFLVSLTLAACSKDCETTTVYSESSDGQPLTRGTADFSKYVAVGNSLTAGYSDNALFIEGQKVSWTNVLAQQFKTVGGGEYKIPFMSDNIGGFALAAGVQFPQAGPRLYYTGNSASPLAAAAGVSSTLLTASIASAGPYNNVGIPGAKCIHLVTPGYATANPYFGRIATSPTQTVLNYATTTIAPTFFSCWIGNNDVLGYATTGGDGSNPITPSAGAVGVGFDASYDAIINGLTAGGAKGVVVSIPYVNTVPFFTTVPFNAIPLNAAQVAALNSAYAPYNAGVTASPLTAAEKTARTITFVVGQNAPVIVDEYLTNLTSFGLPNYRQATAQDYLVLSSNGASAQANLAAGGGTSAPLADRWVLSKGEVAEIKIATDAYNAKIQAVATAKNLAFFDANAVMTQIATTGIVSNGFNVASTFITGGGFSTDGVHPSPRGYALIANKVIESINAKYGSNIKGVNIGDYRILFPAVL